MVLYEHQVPHFNNVLRICREWYAYLDSSRTGTGKTIITIEVAKALELPLLVIGEVSTKGMWEQTTKKYGVELIEFLSYAKLRGNNRYLINEDKYIVSPYGCELFKRGVLLVYDECHNLKNRSRQSEAACCLSSWIALNTVHSRIACLSATPIDKEEQVLSLMRIMGIVLSDKLYEYIPSTEEYILVGLDELIAMAKAIDPATTEKLVPRNIAKHNARSVTFSLFRDVIKPRLSSAIEATNPLPDKDIANGYYEIAEKEELQAGVKLLSKLIRRVGDDIELISSSNTWTQLTKAMIVIERAKVSTMVRLAKETLAMPKAKVILYFNYLECIDKAAKQLQDYRPLVMTGSVNSKDRDTIIEAFNLPDTRYRLLIANTRVAGTGINLDDTHGDFPRYMFMIPTYNFIDLHQATGRIYRATTKSKVTIRLVYGKEDGAERCLEHIILAALARKSEVTRGAVKDSSVIYPGEYPIYWETTA
jgi:hypothetical protein